MKVFNVDTSVLRSSVSVAEQTNEALTEAANLLNAITVHEDWICKEREQIKNMTLSNKEKAQKIQNQSQSFYSAIKSVSEKFDEAEQDCCNRINRVDDIISKVVSVVPGISEVSVGETGSNISIMDFNNLNSSLEG